MSSEAVYVETARNTAVPLAALSHAPGTPGEPQILFPFDPHREDRDEAESSKGRNSCLYSY